LTKFIAEIGWNHLGDLDLAKSMAAAAADSGAHYAKFQTWSTTRLKSGPWDLDGRRQLYEQAELSREGHEQLIEHCNNTGIIFLSSVFSLEDARLLCSLNQASVKIPSNEAVNLPLLEYCLSNFGHLIISVGACSEQEILQLAAITRGSNVTVLHCVSSYPCPIRFSNLNQINFLRSHFADVGYSDHVSGINAAKASLAHGVSFIEKHFTIDKSLEGRDNKFAILPNELQELISFDRDFQLAHSISTTGYQSIEMDIRTNYRSRFNKQ